MNLNSMFPGIAQLEYKTPEPDSKQTETSSEGAGNRREGGRESSEEQPAD